MLQQRDQRYFTDRRTFARVVFFAALLFSLAFVRTAHAQIVVCPLGITTTTCTESTTQHDSHTRVDLADFQAYVTQVVGSINGGIVFDQTVLEAPTSANVATAFTGAVAAVTSAGGPGVLVLGPTLRSSVDVRGASTFVGSQLNHDEYATTRQTTFGPATILIGPDSTTTYFFPSPDTNSNFNTHTEHFIDDQYQALITHTNIYDVVGVVRQLGTVHTVVLSGAYDQSGRFVDALSDEAGEGRAALAELPLGYAAEQDPATSGPFAAFAAVGADDPLPLRFWVRGYGAQTSTPTQGAVPGDVRTSGGVSGGLGMEVAPGLFLGAGLDQGMTAMVLDPVGESGLIQLSQLGVSGKYVRNGWFATAAATMGRGSVHAVQTLGGSSTADYGLGTWSLLAETGYAIETAPVTITPRVGAELTGVQVGEFAGVGGLALSAMAQFSQRLRAWVGVDVETSIPTVSGAIDLAAHARVVGVLMGAGRSRQVTFSTMPGTMLTVTGASEAPVSVDLGSEITWHEADNVKLTAAYDLHLSGSSMSHAGTLSLRVTW
ncbi:MAG: autotransporter outer membrane beta-barrel domain-containing protein [Devosia sp.]